MKINYDSEVDALSVRIAEGEILESDEVYPGVILDYDAEDNVLAVEVLHARKRAEDFLRKLSSLSTWVEGLVAAEESGLAPEQWVEGLVAAEEPAATTEERVERIVARQERGATPEELELLHALRSLPEEVRRNFEQTIRTLAREPRAAADARPARRA